MANKRISELTTITGANLADADLLVVVDVSDTTMAASGTNKKITVAEFATDSALGGSLAKLGSANTFTVGGHIIDNAAAGTIPLLIQGHASQSADYFVIENSAGTDLLSYTTNGLFVSSVAGSLGVGTTNVYGAKVAVNTTANGNLGFVIRAAGAGQTASLQEWQNSGGTALGSVSPAGEAQFVSIDGGTP